MHNATPNPEDCVHWYCTVECTMPHQTLKIVYTGTGTVL